MTPIIILHPPKRLNRLFVSDLQQNNSPPIILPIFFTPLDYSKSACLNLTIYSSSGLFVETFFLSLRRIRQYWAIAIEGPALSKYAAA